MNFGQLLGQAQDSAEWIVDLRRQIHQTPELMYEEVETSRLVRETLDQLGINYESGIAETGVLATLGSGDGPCVALRADMDALPIDEQADVEFRSKVPGKMHACGHDCHTAMLLGAAKILKERESEIRGTVKLVFQPAEEGGAGGLRMREYGILRNPDVQRIFALHVWPLFETGTIASRSGTFLASATNMTINVTGKGGHAAMPHLAIDPVVTSAKIITELQTIVSREIGPLDSLVVSITSVHAGQAHNVIPGEVELKGTIRALTSESMAQAKTRTIEICQAIATANRCQATLNFPGEEYPPTVNDPVAWELAQKIWGNQFGTETVVESSPVMGGEDFSFYTQEIPGCFVGLGIRNESLGCTWSVHHPKFKVDEAALPTGSAFHVAWALESLADLAS